MFAVTMVYCTLFNSNHLNTLKGGNLGDVLIHVFIVSFDFRLGLMKTQ